MTAFISGGNPGRKKTLFEGAKDSPGSHFKESPPKKSIDFEQNVQENHLGLEGGVAERLEKHGDGPFLELAASK